MGPNIPLKGTQPDAPCGAQRAMRGTHLEEHEGGPLELLRALGRLDEAGEAGLPDLQHKEGRGDTLWEEAHTCRTSGRGGALVYDLSSGWTLVFVSYV